MQTKVFELAAAYGYNDNRSLARAMGLSEPMVSRVRRGLCKINESFIAGARRAFPDKTLDDLFYVDEPERAIA